MSQTPNLPIPAEQLRQSLFEETDLNLNFLVLTLSSCMIASLGLLVNSSAVVIGAMIIAPTYDAATWAGAGFVGC